MNSRAANHTWNIRLIGNWNQIYFELKNWISHQYPALETSNSKRNDATMLSYVRNKWKSNCESPSVIFCGVESKCDWDYHSIDSSKRCWGKKMHDGLVSARGQKQWFFTFLDSNRSRTAELEKKDADRFNISLAFAWAIARMPPSKEKTYLHENEGRKKNLWRHEKWKRTPNRNLCIFFLSFINAPTTNHTENRTVPW